MSTLEDRFKENIEPFDSEEPTPGHAERFQKRLSSRKVKPTLRSLWMAATILAGFFVVTQLMPTASPDEAGTVEEATMGLADISPEMAEVELYFSEQIAEKKNSLDTSKDEASLLGEELDKLEQNYSDLKLELSKTQGDERVVRWMIENYRLRLQLLELHLERTEQYNR